MNKKLSVLLILALLVIFGFSLWWTYGRGTPAPANNQGTHTAEPTSASLKLYMIAYNDGGKSGTMIGCNDSAVAVTRTVVGDDMLLTLYKDLLSLRDNTYGESGLHNTLASARLSVDSVRIDEQHVAHIALAGSLNLAGECDAPRVEAQLKKPALQFDGVKSVKVTINGKDLTDVLSLK